jgi:hypothetical protein
MEASAQSIFPESHFSTGWIKSGPGSRFTEHTLYNYINGAAELFNEFGFLELLIQRYIRNNEEITIEVYRMERPESALGIYLMKCGNETPVTSIPARNSGNRFQLTLIKGNTFFQINNFSGNRTSIPVMINIAKLILKSIPKAEEVTLLDILPKDNLIPGSERIIRGPFSLEPLYTFGKGDILQLTGEIFGAAADYRCDGTVCSRIIIPFHVKESAISAVKNLKENLDRYLEILHAWKTGFIFKDYLDQYGVVYIDGIRVDIKYHLAEKPAPPL